jgi:two-component system, OmpR family, sensor histidine kinase BaeS
MAPTTEVSPAADGISARALVMGCFALVAAGMAILVGATLWSQYVDRTHAAQADMAYAQALQVTRLELAAANIDDDDEGGRRALSERAQAYLASIEQEALLPGNKGVDDAHQTEERAQARRLVEAITAGSAVVDLAEVRRLAGAIAAREIEEAAHARAEAAAVAYQTRILVISAAGALLLVPLALALLLQRLLVAPLRRLEADTDDLAAARAGARREPAGLREIRALAARFNAMAEAVEQRVAHRTAQLEQANAELAAVDQRRRLFLAKVSHELRTPVTAIRGEADVALRHGDTPEEWHEALSHIEQTSLFLGRRLDDLMALAQAEDARLTLAHEAIDPFAATRAACEVAAAYARASGVTVALCASPPEAAQGVRVAGDADRLQQAIAAVIDNAIKFSPPGGTVSVSAGTDAGEVVLRIIDEGPGVHPAELAGIFDPYVQGQGGRALGGTGLGLSLARWIAEAYRGRITAENGRGEDKGAEGLCVTMHLPIAA